MEQYEQRVFSPLYKIRTKTQPKPAADPGPKGEITNLPLSSLVVDERYQRQIMQRGRKTIMNILENFDWRKFSVVIVTRTEMGFYAIIDGQHRATAALMHPKIHEVPCLVIDASPALAAECFAAINGNVTAMTGLQIFKARLQANDPEAIKVQEICMEAGVNILPNNIASTATYKRGDTMAVTAIEKCLKQHGETVLKTALQTLVNSGSGNVGEIRANAIYAMCDCFDKYGVFTQLKIHGEDVYDYTDDLDMKQIRIKAIEQAASSPLTTKEHLRMIIEARVREQHQALNQPSTENETQPAKPEEHVA